MQIYTPGTLITSYHALVIRWSDCIPLFRHKQHRSDPKDSFSCQNQDHTWYVLMIKTDDRSSQQIVSFLICTLNLSDL